MQKKFINSKMKSLKNEETVIFKFKLFIVSFKKLKIYFNILVKN